MRLTFAQRTIGIDIGPQAVRAVQVLRSKTGVRVERASVVPCETRQALAAALRSLFAEKHFRPGARIAVAMPAGSVFFQRTETDLPSPAQARQVLRFELEDDFPVRYDDLAVDYCTSPRGVLVGAVSRTQLHQRLEHVREAGLACAMVDADACAILAAAAESRPELVDTPSLIVYADGVTVTLAAAENRCLVNARTLACFAGAASLAREIELTWRDTFGAAMSGLSQVILAGDPDMTRLLAAELPDVLHCRTDLLDAFENIPWPADTDRDPRLAAAFGLALRAAGGPTRGMNFLEADRSTQSHARDLKGSLMISGLLAGAIAMAWGFGVFLRLNHLEQQYRQIKLDTRQVFQKALPAEKKIVSELPQMEERVRALRKQYEALASATGTGAAPLHLLQQISARIPAGQDLKVTDMSIVGRSVRLTGTTGSFRSVDDLKSRLQQVKEFSEVAVHDVGMDRAGGAVRFTITITVASGIN